MRVAPGDDIDVLSPATLGIQNRITDKFIAHATSEGVLRRWLLDIYTGAGKTVMALNILSRLKKKTLIMFTKAS